MAETPEGRRQTTKRITEFVAAVRTDGKMFRVINGMYFKTPEGCKVEVGDEAILEVTTTGELKEITGSYQKWSSGE